MENHSWIWQAMKFETIETPEVSALAGENGWMVKLANEKMSWGYRFGIPSVCIDDIFSRAEVAVVSVSGAHAAGLALYSGDTGFLMQVNGEQKVELCFVQRNVATTRMLELDMPVAPPVGIALEYSVLTNVCRGMAGDKELFEVALPYKNIPVFEAIEAIELVVSTNADSAEGSVTFGDLKYDSE